MFSNVRILRVTDPALIRCTGFGDDRGLGESRPVLTIFLPRVWRMYAPDSGWVNSKYLVHPGKRRFRIL